MTSPRDTEPPDTEPPGTERRVTERPRHGRRRFLKVGIVGSIALGAGGLLAWQTSGYEVPDAIARALTCLSPKEYRIVEAVAERIVRSDDPAFPPARELGVAARIDALIAALHPADRRELRGLLHLVEHGLGPWNGAASRFTRMGGAEQDAVLEAMGTGSSGLLRAGFEGLKSLVALAYFADERAWAAIGYDGPLVGRRA